MVGDTVDSKAAQLRVENTANAGTALHVVEPSTHKTHVGLYVGSSGMDPVLTGGRVGVGKLPVMEGDVLTRATYVSAMLNVNGDLNLAGRASVGSMEISQDLSTLGNAIVHGNLTVSGTNIRERLKQLGTWHPNRRNTSNSARTLSRARPRHKAANYLNCFATWMMPENMDTRHDTKLWIPPNPKWDTIINSRSSQITRTRDTSELKSQSFMVGLKYWARSGT